MRRVSWTQRLGRAGAATALTVATLTCAGSASVAMASTSPGPSIPGLDCPPEQFPAAGTPRNAASVPYEIPFTATLGQKDPSGVDMGGYLQVSNSLVTVTLGGPIEYDATTQQQYGSVYAKACGLLQLPSESGGIAAYPKYGLGNDPNYNNNFVFQNPIPVTVGINGIPGLPVLQAYGSASGDLTASIARTPAANGGLNVLFNGNAKSTSDFGPALGALLALVTGGTPAATLPPSIQQLLRGVTSTAGSACTLTIGNEITEGTPAADVRAGVTGLSWPQATTAVQLTTQTSGHLTGRPVTGPVTQANATLVANDFPVGSIDPNTIPAPSDSSAVCTASNAKLLNNLLGLPSIPDPAMGHYPNAFYAPGTFGVYTSS